MLLIITVLLHPTRRVKWLKPTDYRTCVLTDKREMAQNLNEWKFGVVNLITASIEMCAGGTCMVKRVFHSDSE